MSHYPAPTPAPHNAHLEHAILAGSQYDAGYRGMAIEILALRRACVEKDAEIARLTALVEKAYRQGRVEGINSGGGHRTDWGDEEDDWEVFKLRELGGKA